ncbi:MAG: bifunctional diaminohydroxyphosphoribosylaminopyrimidine deaminase/5-amino-6-(5-phosphoribosylamino)uracil reductase RibD [Candidatus Zixiibacteriota bacterium]
MNDEKLMRLSLQLAEKGRGKTSPNPMVGAVVVKRGQILGKGYHRKCGGPHAEAIALRACGEQAKGATLYINLEPCSHFGKTPPCTHLIIKSGIKKVVCATIDPNPQVNGTGIECLKISGIEVSLGVLEQEARKLNEVYFKYISTGLPFVALTVAQSLDGRILRQIGSSGAQRREVVAGSLQSSNRWIDAILCDVDGAGVDSLHLLSRSTNSVRPKLILLGTHRKISDTLRKLGKDAHGNVILVPTDPAKKTRKKQAEFTSWAPKRRKNGEIDPLSLLKKVGEEGITSLLVDAGPQIATSLLKQGLVDKVWYLISPTLSGKGEEAFGDLKIRKISEAIALRDCEFKQSRDGLLAVGYPKEAGS